MTGSASPPEPNAFQARTKIRIGTPIACRSEMAVIYKHAVAGRIPWQDATRAIYILRSICDLDGQIDDRGWRNGAASRTPRQEADDDDDIFAAFEEEERERRQLGLGLVPVPAGNSKRKPT